MMRKTIRRKLTKSTIYGYKLVMENGEPKVEKVEAVTCWGNVTAADGKKLFAEKYGKDANVMVAQIEQETVCFEISVEDFIAAAHVVENEDNETEDDE